MSVNSPFTPTGNTVTFTGVITTPPTPVQANSYSLGSNQYRILNAGTVTVFLGIGNTAAGATANAKGNVFSGGNVVPFAKGGIVNRPTVFPMKNGMGLMGEAGPEAVMPLSRGANGKLGVSAAPMNVIINNNAPGVAVKTRQSEGGLTIDVVMQQVANAVAKGGNPIANALESSYSLGRGRAVY